MYNRVNAFECNMVNTKSLAPVMTMVMNNKIPSVSEKCPLFLIYLYFRLKLEYFGSVSCKRQIHLCIVTAKKFMMVT